MLRSGGGTNIHLTLLLAIYHTGRQACPTIWYKHFLFSRFLRNKSQKYHNNDHLTTWRTYKTTSTVNPECPGYPTVHCGAQDPRNLLDWHIIILLYTCDEIKRKWIKITYRKTFWTYAVKLDLVCSHKRQDLKPSAGWNEWNFLNSEYGKSTPISSFLSVGLMQLTVNLL